MSTASANHPATPENPVDDGWRGIVLCLRDWLKQNGPSDQKAHRILSALAAESLKVAGRSDEEGQRQFTASDIAAVAGEASWEDSKGLNWKKDVEPYWESKREDIIRLATARGLSAYPDLQRHSTPGRHKATFEIVARPLPAADVSDVPEGPTAPTARIIHYLRSEPGTVKPTFWFRPFFHRGEFRLAGWRRWLILTWLMVSILATALVVLFLSWGLLTPRSINTSHIAILLTILILPVVIWFELLAPWLRLLEDRISPASEFVLALGEDNAQLEVYRDANTRVIRLVRYSATCVFCGASVYLDDGAPDFPRRLVGRCAESPREHVFSFDRVNLRGAILRNPP